MSNLKLLVLLSVACITLPAAISDKRFVMNSAETLVVGRVVLPPGVHVWTLLDLPSHLVEIRDQKTLKVEALILAMPSYRQAVTENNRIEFWETPVGCPKAVRSWFYPGDNYGQEFPYSKKTVLRLRSAVLVTPLEPMAQSPARILTSESAPHPILQRRLVQPQTPQGSWAIVTGESATSSTSAPPTKAPQPSNGLWGTLRKLPLTATLAPLIGLIGAGCVLLYFASQGKKRRLQS